MIPKLIHMRCPFGGLQGCPSVIEVEWENDGVYRATGCAHLDTDHNGDKEWKAILLLGAVQQMILDAWEQAVANDVARVLEEADRTLRGVVT